MDFHLILCKWRKYRDAVISQRSETLQVKPSGPEPIRKIGLKGCWPWRRDMELRRTRVASVPAKGDSSSLLSNWLDLAPLGYTTLGVSMRVFPERFNYRAKSSVSVRNTISRAGVLCWTEIKKCWISVFIFSLFPPCLWIQCDPMPRHHTFPAMMDWNCEPTRITFFSSVTFCPAFCHSNR